MQVGTSWFSSAVPESLVCIALVVGLCQRNVDQIVTQKHHQVIHNILMKSPWHRLETWPCHDHYRNINPKGIGLKSFLKNHLFTMKTTVVQAAGQPLSLPSISSLCRYIYLESQIKIRLFGDHGSKQVELVLWPTSLMEHLFRLLEPNSPYSKESHSPTNSSLSYARMLNEHN